MAVLVLRYAFTPVSLLRPRLVGWILSASLLVGLLPAQSVEDLDRENGWGDVKLGTLGSEMPGLVIEGKSTDGRELVATRSKENLRHGNFALTKILYTFFDGVLWKVEVQVADTNVFRALEGVLKAGYTKGALQSTGGSGRDFEDGSATRSSSFDGFRNRISFYETEGKGGRVIIENIGYRQVWLSWYHEQRTRRAQR